MSGTVLTACRSRGSTASSFMVSTRHLVPASMEANTIAASTVALMAASDRADARPGIIVRVAGAFGSGARTPVNVIAGTSLGNGNGIL